MECGSVTGLATLILAQLIGGAIGLLIMWIRRK